MLDDRNTPCEDALDCPICLMPIEKNASNTCVTECGHAFHTRCLCTAARTSIACPVCRHKFCGRETQLDETEAAAARHNISSVLEHLVHEMREMRSSQQAMRREGGIVGRMWLNRLQRGEPSSEYMSDSLRRSLLFATGLSETAQFRQNTGFSLVPRSTRRLLPPIVVPWPVLTQSDDDDDENN